MTGVFNSANQAAADPSYYDVQLATAPIWTERDDGCWLYVEQAISEALDRPYRQRVYHLVHDAETGDFRSDISELPGDPLAYVGAWREPARLNAIGPADLVLRRGCSIELRYRDGAFAGATRDRDCESSLRGASYATSEVIIAPDRLTSWDRGYDSEGQQVWGAVDGPYVFDRISG